MLKNFIDSGRDFISNEVSIGKIENLYLAKNLDDVILRGIPGFRVFKTLTSGHQVRGLFFNPVSLVSNFGTVYIVKRNPSGGTNIFSKLSLSGLAETTLGTFTEVSWTKPRFANSESRIVIVSFESATVRTIDAATDVVTSVNNASVLTLIEDVCFIGGFFIFACSKDNKFFFTDNPTVAIPATNNYVTQSKRDAPFRVFNVSNFLFILNNFTIEIWQQTGNSLSPFEPVVNSFMYIGCNIHTRHTWEQIGDALVGLCTTPQAKYKLVVVSRNGYKYIDTNLFFDWVISNFYDSSGTTFPKAQSFLLNVENKTLYCLNIDYISSFADQILTSNITFAYDFELDAFYTLVDGNGDPWNFPAHCNLVGYPQLDGSSNKYSTPTLLAQADNTIYIADQKIYNEDLSGLQLIHTFVTKTIEKPNHQLFDISSVELLINKDLFGTQLYVEMLVSKDRGLTWISQGAYDFNTYEGRIMWLRIGTARHFTFQFSISTTGKHVVVNDIIINGETEND